MKAYSKRAKRAAKKAKSTSRSLYDQWKEDATPIAAVEADDPLRTVTQARRRHLGKKRGDDVLAPYLGDEAGKAIFLGVSNHTEAQKLWELFKQYDAAQDAHSRLILGRSRHPACSKMEFMPERLEASASDNIDLRSESEKITDAIAGAKRWGDHLAKLTSMQRAAIRSASRQERELQAGGKLNTRGKLFVSAMRALRKLVDV